MPPLKKYFQDKSILSLLSLNLFLVLLVTIIIALRISANSGEEYVIQYRSYLGGEVKTGSIINFIYIIAFAVIVVVFHFILSLKTYHIRRQLAITLLCMSALLLVVAFIVSNQLLMLH